MLGPNKRTLIKNIPLTKAAKSVFMMHDKSKESKTDVSSSKADFVTACS